MLILKKLINAFSFTSLFFMQCSIKMKKIQLLALLIILFASAIACKKDQVTVTGAYFP